MKLTKNEKTTDSTFNSDDVNLKINYARERKRKRKILQYEYNIESKEHLNSVFFFVFHIYRY